MPTDAEQLATIKSQTLAILADVTANPKPAYMVDGQSVQWTAYTRMLMDKIETINKLLNAETPYEYHSRGFS